MLKILYHLEEQSSHPWKFSLHLYKGGYWGYDKSDRDIHVTDLLR